MDFFIVLASIVDFMPFIDGGGLSAVRAMRLLRPLRALKRIPSLRILVGILIDTVPMIINVVGLTAFFYWIFAILGVQLFMGIFHNRCYDPAGLAYTPDVRVWWTAGGPASAPVYLCSQDDAIHQGGHVCPPETQSLNDTWILHAAQFTQCVTKTENKNPGAGAISFDDTWHAFVTIFQVASLEMWSDIEYAVMDAYSFWVWIYFVLCVFCCNFFAANLFLVVIANQVMKTDI